MVVTAVILILLIGVRSGYSLQCWDGATRKQT